MLIPLYNPAGKKVAYYDNDTCYVIKDWNKNQIMKEKKYDRAIGMAVWNLQVLISRKIRNIHTLALNIPEEEKRLVCKIDIDKFLKNSIKVEWEEPQRICPLKYWSKRVPEQEELQKWVEVEG